MKSASDIIDELGGTSAVARLCRVKPPSVSEWRKKGIPDYRLMYLAEKYPDVVPPLPEADAGRAQAA